MDDHWECRVGKNLALIKEELVIQRWMIALNIVLNAIGIALIVAILLNMR